MRLITLSVVLGVVLGFLGRSDSLQLLGGKIQRFRSFALKLSTDIPPIAGSACTLPPIEDTTTQSERATKGSVSTCKYCPQYSQPSGSGDFCRSTVTYWNEV